MTSSSRPTTAGAFDILLLDEVLAVGDEAFQEKCFATFEQFQEEGKTIVFVSHDMVNVRRFCDRVLLLKGSAARMIGDADDVTGVHREHMLVA